MFNQASRPAAMSIEQLKADASDSRRRVLEAVRPQGDVIDQEVLSKTRDEISRGWLKGPIDCDKLEAHDILNRRFGLDQGSKVRLIDDFSFSDVNATVGVKESPKPHAVDVIAGMTLNAMPACPGQKWLGSTSRRSVFAPHLSVEA
ncbi:hypothetical protein AK812_SmicGene8833 [Symbiodinium microadriaticum]|uniref:Uncharacterized protein n=1 Tax=Symbiodinium microadriaticum TaxID=2951 RepID=A0A1Q9EJV0_SYMMI|nr:hypothetical protein AK812_SmicGene8833 [Symbiodinium microadriaticum]